MSEVASSVEDLTTSHLCPWCNDILCKPKILVCGHNLCEHCVEKLLCFSILQSFDVCTSRINIPEANEDRTKIPKHCTVDKIICPVSTCKKSTPVSDYGSLVDSLDENQSLVDMCDRMLNQRKSKQCGWCENELATQECGKCEVIFCEACRKETHARDAFKSHQFYDIGELEKQKAKTCAKHKGRRKDLFCRDCSQSLCLYCTKFETDHKDHQLCSFAEASKDIHKDIEQLMTRHQYISRDIATFHETIRRAYQNLKAGAENVANEVKSAFDRARDILAAQENELLTFVTERTKEDMNLASVIEQSLETVEKVSKSIVDSYPKDAQDPAYLIQHKKTLSRLIMNMEDIQMETSLYPIRFDFDQQQFAAALAKVYSVSEHLDVGVIDSCIASDEGKEQLVKWLSRVLCGRKQISLVYRASHNGWSDQKLHEICERISDPVLVIGKTDSGHVFGGYQSGSWKKTNSFMGKDSFLFSLSDGKTREAILIENSQFDELKQFQYSPRDLRFQLNNKLVASQLGNSYKIPPNYESQGSTLLLGAPQSTITELELFCIGNIQSQGPKMQEILRGQLKLKQALGQMLKRQYHPSDLLYKASRDGWFPSTFHELCDDKGPTLVLAKSEHGHIFGGYAEKDWGGRHIMFKGFIQDPNAVLFSLSDGQGRQPFLLKLKHPKTALQNDYKAGPCYGAGNDLRISLSDQSVQCNPHSYIIPSGYRQDTFLAGQSSCRLDEVEVYSFSQ